MLGVCAVGVWIALSFVFSLASRAVALLGYVVVAVVAYFFGKAVGSAGRGD